MLVILVFATAGDRDKFEYLYARYKNLLLQKANGILRDYMQAEDAVSECYLRVFKNLHKIENPDANTTIAFLVTIVRNVALTMVKRGRAEFLDDEGDADYPDGTDFTEDVLAGIAAAEIYSLIGKLEPGLRDVFLLKYAHDLSHREIGAALGLTENNVTVRLFRAKRKLITLLETEGLHHGNETD